MFTWLSTVVIQRISATLDADSIIRIGIILIKTHFVALRIRLNPPPGDAHGFLK